MGATAIVERPVISNQTFIGLLPRSGLESRYLYYLMQSRSSDLQAQATGAIQQYLSRDDFRSLRIRLPPTEEQRRIANFLDAQTGRIDQLERRRRRMEALIESRRWSLFESLVSEVKTDDMPARRTIRSITDGPFGSAFSSDDYVDDGPAVVRLGNIGFDEYRHENQARVSMDIYRQVTRCHVRRGDVLIAGLGDTNNHAGRACVAPDLGSALVKGKCFCARVNTEVVSPRYLSLVLSSTRGEQSLSTRGSTRSMINLELLKEAVIPVPSIKQQCWITREVDNSLTRDRSLLDTLECQLSLLAERRHALITAAVTGQLDVTTARSGVRP